MRAAFAVESFQEHSSTSFDDAPNCCLSSSSSFFGHSSLMLSKQWTPSTYSSWQKHICKLSPTLLEKQLIILLLSPLLDQIKQPLDKQPNYKTISSLSKYYFLCFFVLSSCFICFLYNFSVEIFLSRSFSPSTFKHASMLFPTTKLIFIIRDL